MQQQHEKIRKKRDYSQDLKFPGLSSDLFRGVAPQSRIQYRDATTHNIFPDPLFKEQWYLVSRVCVHCFLFFSLSVIYQKKKLMVEDIKKN